MLKGLAVVVLGLACAACGADDTQPPSPGAFNDVLSGVVAEANSGGAGEGQLAILEQARTDGEMSYELTKQAVVSAVNCMTDAGLDAQIVETTRSSGLVSPGYRAAVASPTLELSEEAASAIIDECDRQESLWILSFYQTQPTSLQLIDAEVARKAPLLLACLEREGRLAPLTRDSTPNELANRASIVAAETMFEVDCLTEAEIDAV